MVEKGPVGSKAKFRVSIPPLVWRILDAVVAAALAVGFMLAVMVINGFLLNKGSYQQGFNAWLAFIQRPDIIGTLIVSIFVTVVYLSWRIPPRR